MAKKCKFDLNAVGYGPMVGFCEHDDKYGLSMTNGILIFIVIRLFSLSKLRAKNCNSKEKK
jgi:hypothetical protein